MKRCGQEPKGSLCGRRGGELCNEGMLRKQGPTGSLTTIFDKGEEPIKLAPSRIINRVIFG